MFPGGKKGCIGNKWVNEEIPNRKLNPFMANNSILHPLKSPENQKFYVIFRDYEMGLLARNGLIFCTVQSFFLKKNNRNMTLVAKAYSEQDHHLKKMPNYR